MSQFTENPRVKIPAIVHLTRLGYGYLSIKDQQIKSQIDPDTNIFKQVFINSLIKINTPNTPPHSDYTDEIVDRIRKVYRELSNKQLDSYDCGKSFYDAITNGVDDIKLIDFNNFNNNTFNVVTELPYVNSGDEFRPDITILVNGMPLAFIEVKKPNNQDGMLAEQSRINQRFKNRHFNKFANITQLMIFSNNMEYDDEGGLFQGAFYATPAIGNNAKVYFNHFREQKRSEFIDEIKPIDPVAENSILEDNNYQIIKNSPEYITNKDEDTPTNRIISSLLSKPRLEFLLQYAFAFINPGGGDPQRQIMRYPQLFATKAISATLDNGIKKGVIWHTQGSGKTALTFYNVKYLTDYFAKQHKITKFYFIVDRLDLLNQAVQEFTKRGLKTRTVTNKQALIDEFASSNTTYSGENEICVINIQKFRDDTVAVNSSGYSLNIQRVYFIDEAHRSYNPGGSYLANLYQSDKDSIKIALTGTPLIIYNDHKRNDEYDEDLSSIIDRKTTVGIFGEYIHKYYYTDSIRDGYTLRLIREGIATSYREQAAKLLDQIQVQYGDLRKSDLYANSNYVSSLLRYIIDDFINSRQTMNKPTIGGMIVCYTSGQAREVYKQLQANYPNIKSALILCDVDTKEIRKQHVDDFKAGNIDILVVFNMLLTGFDAPRLKKLYLCRIIKAHNLLQALTRVNRPFNGMKFGYVVDFANISDEFELTNEHYLNELKREYSTGMDSDDGNVFGSLFVGKAEIERQIKSISRSLADYNTSNAEIFSHQINQIRDKCELNRLAEALGNARSLYNIIRLFGHDDLLNKLDFTRLNDEYREAQNRLELLNIQQAAESDTSDRALLDKAIENVVFDFTRTSKEELKLEKSANQAKDLSRRIRIAMQENYDQEDEQFVSLRQEFYRLMHQADISRNQTSIIDFDETIAKLNHIYDRMMALNRRNDEIASVYNGDHKYAIADKELNSFVGEPIPTYQRQTLLNNTKEQVDNIVSNNEGVIENEGYFKREVMKSLIDSAAEAKVDINRDARVEAMNLLVMLYLRDLHEGEN